MCEGLRSGAVLLLSAYLYAWFGVPGAVAHDGSIVLMSAASLDPEVSIAPGSLAVMRGEFSTRTVRPDDGLPTAELAGYSVKVEGSGGAEVPALLVGVEPTRLVILVPDLPAGTAHLRVLRYGLEVEDGEFGVQLVSPGLFSAAGTGGGLADARALRMDLSDGSETAENVSFFNPNRSAHEAIPLGLGVAGTELYLSVRATGLRDATEVSSTIGGLSVPALLEGSEGLDPGIDRVRIGPLPSALAQRQLVNVQVVADGSVSNLVQVAFSPTSGAAVTFSNQIVRLFQGHCQTCHRPGEVAPFSLMEYEEARDWAQPIKLATQSGFMPPWKPVAGHGEFQHERGLDQAEIDLIARWVDAGAPQGDAEDLPDPIVFDEDWVLGTPDLVLETPAYTPDPGGEDDYRCFSVLVPPEITEPKSLTAFEVRPGNRKIVHHLILFGDPGGESAELEAATSDGRPGYECFGSAGISTRSFNLIEDSYILGGWAPGYTPNHFPDGSGLVLRPGARIAIQVHYHPDGTDQSDATRIGLHFSEERTEKNLLILAAINTSFVIPAGAERHEVRAEFDLEGLSRSLGIPGLRGLLTLLGFFPANIVAVLPHMHTLGREIRMDKVSPDGEVTPMIYIDDWDFDWQDMYMYVEPVQLNAEDRLEVVAYYDNSADNPNNPNDPPIDVRWGDRTVDEMCIVFFMVEVPSLNLGSSTSQ
ncbi:MAG: hypothetical protein OXN89_01485 [Bryobacterales bacterium]|nr:hypothetical protein [Bryobacterales bacterium]